MTAIKKYRKLKGLTQAQLADLLNLKRSTVAMWEIGGNKPDIVTIKKLSQIFLCSVDELLSDYIK